MAPTQGGAAGARTTGRPTLRTRFKHAVFGSPRDIEDRSLFHRLSLIPFLAWVGLGADGLSSSAYGPDEAFRTLGEHTYLALALAAVVCLTIFIIAKVYSHIIRKFPHGGGGYLVATTLLGQRAGIISGCALLVDYVLTVTVSIAAAGDALFSFLPVDPSLKLPIESGLVVLLILLNLRGVRESVLVLVPIFLTFVVTHIVVIMGGIAVKLPELGSVLAEASGGFGAGMSALGLGGVLLLFLHAYSLGGGTYTGIEAVSNGLGSLREPRVENGQTTMRYMAWSLAFTAAGLLLCYLLWKVTPVASKTMNAVLLENLTAAIPGGHVFVVLTLFAEGALLVVAAQAGFIDGPRVLANLAIDSWAPRRFAALSERLTAGNGIVLMGIAALAALLYTGGHTRDLVVMYSINVFLTFSLSTFAMLRASLREKDRDRHWVQRTALFIAGFALCVTILVVTTAEKFLEGGWLTLLITGAVIALCFLVRGHYRRVAATLGSFYAELESSIPIERGSRAVPADPGLPTAAFLVAGYGGLGIHTILTALRMFPGNFKNLVFLSVGVIDSGNFKGEGQIAALRSSTEAMLGRYMEMARGLGFGSAFRCSVGTDVVAEAEKLCRQVSGEFPKTTFFIGKVIFRNESWYHRLLHNETAFAVQKRLEWAGMPMVILPSKAGS